MSNPNNNFFVPIEMADGPAYNNSNNDNSNNNSGDNHVTFGNQTFNYPGLNNPPAAFTQQMVMSGSTYHNHNMIFGNHNTIYPHLNNPQAPLQQPQQMAGFAQNDQQLADPGFWGSDASFQLTNGQPVVGTFMHLYQQSPELREPIMAGQMAYHNFDPFAQINNGTSTDINFNDFVNDAEHEVNQVAGASVARVDGDSGPMKVSSTEPKQVGEGREESEEAEYVEEPSDNSAPTPPATPDAPQKSQATGEEDADAEEPADAEETDEGYQASSPDKETSQPAAIPRVAPAGAPQYVSDINSAQDARDELARSDTTEYTVLAIANDDVATVIQMQHHFAQQLFDALLVPGLPTPTTHQLVKAAQDKWDAQMKDGLEKVDSLLQTLKQQKDARARCILAVDAAVSVHTEGIPTTLWDKVTAPQGSKEHNANRSAHADITSICSVRLGKMVTAVKDHKFVAFDMLTKTENMARFAYDPEYYVYQKVEYLLSNARRQMTAKEVQGAVKEKRKAEGKPKKARRAKRAAVEESDEEDDETVSAARKQTRAKRAKKQ